MFKIQVNSTESLAKSKNAPLQEGELMPVANLRHWNTYEYLVYNLDVLVPEDEPTEIFVPKGSYLQKVSFRDKQKWRVLKDTDVNLPRYLVEHKKLEENYDVFKEDSSFLPIFDSTSNFLRKWDLLGLALLLFTATVTPFETAFITGTIQVDVLFLINRCVDFVFMFDMFVQSRTPYRDKVSGKLVRAPGKIFIQYAKGWFFIDLISVIPFELLGFIPGDSSSSSQLSILRVLRLTKLAKLLRIFRASRKMKQLTVYISLRYSSLQLTKYLIMIVFLIHWFACGYRIAAERTNPLTEDPGWVDTLAVYHNSTADGLDTMYVYLAAVYISCATISLVGNSTPFLQPISFREWGFAIFATFVAYFLAVYFISSLSDILASSSKTATQQDITIDNYLEMFDRLKLNISLKIKVNDYLSGHFSQLAQTKENDMMKNLPVALHGFIAMEIFMEFLLSIPYFQPFIEREPLLTQDLCRGIEVRSFSANSLLFTEGIEGIYYLEHGILAIEGKIIVSGNMFGFECLREETKKCEARCLTNVDIHFLPTKVLNDVLADYPKVKYYVKRWIAWELVRMYILAYKELYYTAAKRGAFMIPPLLSSRPNMNEGEYDDIDIAVLEHIKESGY